MADKALGFNVNPASVAFFLAIVSVLGVGFTVASWVNGRTAFEASTEVDFNQLRKDIQSVGTAVSEMKTEVGTMNGNMVQLSLDMRELQTIVRNPNGTLTGINLIPSTPSR